MNALIASLPLIAAVVGVVSGVVSVLVHLLRGVRHVRSRPVAKPAHAPPPGETPSQGPSIRTPDQRLRIFVSSTLQELAAERTAARQAITRLRLSPVLFELGARPHPPKDLYRAYLAQSDVFVGIYWQKYGWVAPGEDVSGLEDEYRLAGSKPKLVYIKAPAQDREPRLTELLDRIRNDDHVSYKPFRTVSELRNLIADDLALLITEHFGTARLEPEHRAPASAAPPAVVEQRAQTNLPIQSTSFVGREREVGEIKALLAATRLLTLTGPGGVGKTRLALQTAADVLDEYPDGVWLIELAPVAQPELVPHVVARALNVDEVPGQGIIETLSRALHARQLMLVFDNCEHMVESCAEVADALVRSTPAVRILATSRERLGVSGETIWNVHGLSAPPAETLPELHTIADYPSVTLFVERARSVQPDFALTIQNAQAVADICTRLEGLPLAIELAAARVRVLTVAHVAARLDNPFGLLTGGSRTTSTRQQTLRATIDWSYGLLGDEERAVFNRLGVFVGGFSLEAAENICTQQDVAPADVLDLLTSLVDKSLVTVENRGGAERFGMLASMREYAIQKLRAAGEEHAVREQHCAWYVALAVRAEPQLSGAEQATWFATLEREHDNLRAALTWTLENSDAGAGLRLAGALWEFWREHGHLTEGRQWLEQQLEQRDIDNHDLATERVKVVNSAAAAAGMQGDYERGSTLAASGLALSRQLGDEDGIARALATLGNLAQERGDFERSAALHEESLTMRRALGDPRKTAWSLSCLGWIRHVQGDHARAAELYEEALTLSREVRDEPTVALTLLNLGDLVRRRGDLQQASALYKESLTRLQRIGEVAGDAHVFAGVEAAEALEGFARVLIASGLPESATRLLGAAAALRERMRSPVPATQRPDFDDSLRTIHSQLDSERFAIAWNAGRCLSSEQAIAYALNAH